MDLLTTVGVCSLYRDVGLILAMVMRFSTGNPYVVVDARHFLGVDSIEDDQEELSADSLSGEHTQAKTADEAWLMYQRIAASGGTPVMGLLPVSPAWANMLGRQPRDVLNACTAVTVGTAMLDEFARQCGGRDRKCVLRKYAAALQLEGYDQDVLEELHVSRDAGGGRAAIVDTDIVREAPIAVPVRREPADAWGVGQLSIPSLRPPPTVNSKPSGTTPSSERRVR